MDNLQDIQDYYASYDEDARLSRHQLEFEITQKYLEEWIYSADEILELGAGTGKYTELLAKRGKKIHAIDLSPRLVAQAKERIKPYREATVTLEARDARDLSHLKSLSFDAVMIMGPLYHLVDRDERLRLLKSAHGLLKPGGKLLSSHISRLGLFGYMMRKYPNWIFNEQEIDSVLRDGIDHTHARAGKFRAYFGKPEQTVAEHQSAGFEMLRLGALEPAIGPYDEAFNQLVGAERSAWVDRLYSLSAVPAWVGSSMHAVYGGEKKTP